MGTEQGSAGASGNKAAYKHMQSLRVSARQKTQSMQVLFQQCLLFVIQFSILFMRKSMDENFYRRRNSAQPSKSFQPFREAGLILDPCIPEQSLFQIAALC
jgi:hypothetical protein